MSKDIQYYMSLPYTLEITPDSGGYVIAVRELVGCFTQVDKWEEIPAMIEDAMRLWIELALERGRPIPEPIFIPAA